MSTLNQADKSFSQESQGDEWPWTRGQHGPLPHSEPLILAAKCWCLRAVTNILIVNFSQRPNASFYNSSIITTTIILCISYTQEGKEFKPQNKMPSLSP